MNVRIRFRNGVIKTYYEVINVFFGFDEKYKNSILIYPKYRGAISVNQSLVDTIELLNDGEDFV